MTAPNELADRFRSDDSGSACDKDSHGRRLEQPRCHQRSIRPVNPSYDNPAVKGNGRSRHSTCSKRCPAFEKKGGATMHITRNLRGARWQLAVVSLALSAITFGCASNRNAANGEPAMSTPSGSMSPATAPGSSGANTTPPAASVESSSASSTASAVKPVSRADEAAAILSGHEPQSGKVLGSVSSGRAASSSQPHAATPPTGQYVPPAVTANPGVTGNSSINSEPGINPSVASGSTSPASASSASTTSSQPFVANDGTGTVTTSSAPVFSKSGGLTPVASSPTATPGSAAGSAPDVMTQGPSTVTGTSGTPTLSNNGITPGTANSNPAASTAARGTKSVAVTRTTQTTIGKKTTKSKRSTASKTSAVPAPAVQVTTDANGKPVVTNVKPATTSTNPPRR